MIFVYLFYLCITKTIGCLTFHLLRIWYKLNLFIGQVQHFCVPDYLSGKDFCIFYFNRYTRLETYVPPVCYYI